VKIKIIILILFTMCFSLSAQELTFRGYAFGTFIDDIIAKEGTPANRYTSKDRGLFAGDEGMNYVNIVVANHAATMEMEFKDKKLLAGAYDITLKNKSLSLGAKDPREVSQVYNDLLTKLTALYGKPVKSNNIELIEGPISNMLAQEINQGSPYSTTWEYKGGCVVLMATMKENWSLGLLYISPETYKLVNESNKSNEGL